MAKEIRDEILERLKMLIQAKRKGYEVVFITKYAGSYYLYLLENKRPYANMQVFASVYSDGTLELSINKIEFTNSFPTSERLKELEDICEQVAKEINELPTSIHICEETLKRYDSVWDYLLTNYGYICASYDEEDNETFTNIKWLVQEQLESENK